MRSAGIDLGDDRLTAVVVDENGRMLARSQSAAHPPTPAHVRDAFAALDAEKVDTIGITMSAHANAADLTAELSRLAGVTARAVHQGQAVALAEAWCGAARECDHVVAFSIADHVTAGIIIAGRVLEGHSGHAASVAWLALNPVEREDYRRLGGLEAEVAASGIVRRLVWRIKSGDTSRVVERVNGELARLTANDVIAAAREGDGVCVSVIRDTAKYVGMAVANLVSVIDPECVVLGGTLTSAGDLMLDAIRTECARRVRPSQADSVRIVVAALGDDAAAIGAARAAMLPT
jgi:glucokinase